MKKDTKGGTAKGDDYYKSIGFMCGLEIHQRLATECKLFCSCSSSMGSEKKPIMDIGRRQRAVAGELGSVDVSAEFEENKERSFTYRVFKDNTCLVDIDEEPPHLMNAEALRVSLSIASSMGMRIVDELQPMRKAVVDGSDPSAFQRTIMVGLNGRINVNGLEVAIPSMFLEEESSGIAASGQKAVTYDTDRLGIPLIEIDTDPYIPNPQAAKEVALHIGTMLRVTGAVQRGIGSIRQDVNMSIKGGARVELKGVQELALIDRFLENEIRRQQELIAIKAELLKRSAKVGRPKGLTKLFKGTEAKILKGNEVFGLALHGFMGILGREVNPERRFGTEMSDYAKMAGVRGLIHSDEDLGEYGITAKEADAVRKELSLNEGDAFVLIAGNHDMAERAAHLAARRAEYAMEGVPKETRSADNTVLCTSKFMRPLPTGSRMYPETDTRPMRVTKELIEQAMGESVDIETEAKFLKSRLSNHDIVKQLITSPRLRLFKRIIGETKADPDFVANTLLQKLTELRRSGHDAESVPDERFVEMFRAYSEGRVSKNGVEELIKELAEGRSVPLAQMIKEKGLERITGQRLRELVKEEVKKGGEKDVVRRIMAKHRLSIDGAELNEIVRGV